MQLLDVATVKRQLNMSTAIASIEQLLAIQKQHPNWVKSPERLVIPTFDATDKHTTGSHLSMPCVIYDGENEYAVVKLVSICPDNSQRDKPTTMATITVSDNATGETLVFMDGVYVTQVRTAALSAIATKHLAKKDAQVVAVVGTGGMAYEQLNAVLTVCPSINTVNLWNRTSEGAHNFKHQFLEQYPQWSVNITVCEELKTAIADADVINLATRATSGLFESNHIKSDVHINAVGAYQPHMKEVSDSVIQNSSGVFVDDVTGAKHEAGDLIQADKSGDCDWQWNKISGSLADLSTHTLNDDKSSNYRQSMTVFKSVGAASFDAAVAVTLAKQAQKKSLGEQFSLT